MSIGDRIRDLRWHRRLKQGELARRAEIAQNTLSRIELGETTPSVQTVVKIAGALDVPPSDLLEELVAAGKAQASSRLGQPETAEVPEPPGRPSVIDIALDAARRQDAAEKRQMFAGPKEGNLSQRYANEAMERLREEYSLSAEDAEELVDFMQKKYVWLRQNYERLQEENDRLREALATARQEASHD